MFILNKCFLGAYLVPYFILLLIIGIPLFFLELAVGQKIRRGSIGVWNYVCPRLGGIGMSSLMVRTCFPLAATSSARFTEKILPHREAPAACLGLNLEEERSKHAGRPAGSETQLDTFNCVIRKREMPSFIGMQEHACHHDPRN